MLAERMKGMKASEIREILKLTEKPDMISFAGGLPEPDLFPADEISKVTRQLLKENGEQALQYSTTEGFVPLRKKIARRMNEKFNIQASYDEIIMINGSQQGLDLTGKLFLDPGDAVLCENPTYLGAINAFKAYQPRFIDIASDDEGMDLTQLETALINEKIKVIYVMPDFQNPTGKSWSYQRRIEFIELINRFHVIVVEDNPYGELRYEGKTLPSLKSLDKTGKVVFLGTFSKILCPGFRIGWLIAEKRWMEQYVFAKQATDLQTSTISQRQIDLYLEHYNLDEHIQQIQQLYKERRDVMLALIKQYFPASVHYTLPQGGLFIWVELPKRLNAKQLLTKSIEQKVAFVPGDSFFANHSRMNTFRLNFSNMDEQKIKEGIKRLANVINESLS